MTQSQCQVQCQCSNPFHFKTLPKLDNWSIWAGQSSEQDAWVTISILSRNKFQINAVLEILMVVAAIGQILVGTIPLPDITSTQDTSKFLDIHISHFPGFPCCRWDWDHRRVHGCLRAESLHHPVSQDRSSHRAVADYFRDQDYWIRQSHSES